ncbi:MAG: sterol desaturase family protein [Lysobacter sp.]
MGLPAMLSLMLWLVLTIVALALAEKIAPYRDNWHPTLPDLKRDAGMFSLNVIADGIADVMVLGIAVMAATNASDLPLVVQVVAGIFIAELGAYTLHRLSHNGGWLWHVHVVHHLPAAVNTSNSFNAHPVNGLYNKIARVAPLVLLGASADAIFIIALFGLMQGMVVHANVRGRLGILNWVIGTAELHRLHHSLDLDQAQNFGTTVPLWDQLLGTYRAPAHVERVGVSDPRAYPDVWDFWALLRFPFAGTARPRLRKRCCA